SQSGRDRRLGRAWDSRAGAGAARRARRQRRQSSPAQSRLSLRRAGRGAGGGGGAHMINDDLCFLSIAELGGLMRARTVSPVEVTEALLARIARLNPTLTAFVTVMAGQAREAARRAEAEL